MKIFLTLIIIFFIIGCNSNNDVDKTAKNTSTLPIAAESKSTSTSSIVKELTVKCVIDSQILKVSCETNRTSENSKLEWSNVDSGKTGGGTSFNFTIHDIKPQTSVNLKECINEDCQEIEKLIDTSALVTTSSGKQSKEIKSDAQSTSASQAISIKELSKDLKATCLLDAQHLKVSCEAQQTSTKSKIEWISKDSGKTGEGTSFNFTIYDIKPQTSVILKECINEDCKEIEILIDTSSLVEDTHASALTNMTSKKTPSAPPVLNLPFRTDSEPVGMMPMGETILHPSTPDNPGGHPGIDFQWTFRAEVIAATNGKVAEIRISEPHGSLLYSILVISGDFVIVYDVTDIYSFNPNLDIDSEIVSGQVIGYAEYVGSGDGWTSMHWAFGKWMPGSTRPNPEGVIEKYRVDYQCPVPYFSDTELQRLFRLWEAAIYPDGGGFKGVELKKQFPDVCNGLYKNY